MAEIKSTIDLVMERTRSLTMSDEDRRRQAEAEFRDAVNGLVRKYLDREMSLERFRGEYSRIEGSSSQKGAAAAEIAGKIDPQGDSRALLDLLKDGLGLDVSVIEAALENFRSREGAERSETFERMKGELLRKGVSGSAVVPNLDADEAFKKRRDELLEECRREILAGGVKSSPRA